MIKRLSITTRIVLLLALPLSATSQSQNIDVAVPSNWAEYKFNNAVFSIKVPPTLELRGEDDKYTILEQTLTNTSPVDNLIIFQQKGLAFNLQEARQRYARVMIQYYTEAYNLFPTANEQIDFSKQEVLEIIDGELFGADMRAYNISYGKGVVNGNQSFIIRYTRTGVGSAPPVRCKICILCNRQHFVKIIYSYREKEFDIWSNDFEKSLQTFRWLR